jgi:hypothetical protein
LSHRSVHIRSKSTSIRRRPAQLAFADGVAAGYLLAVPVFSLEHQGLTAEINELFVRAQHRAAALGRGLAGS